MNDLITAIASVIASKYDHIIYINDIGEGFKRPSFFIYFISGLDQNLNRWTYNTNTLVQIVYFSPLDNYRNAGTTDQLTVIETIKKVFIGKMYVKVGDKVTKIKQVNVDYTSEKDIFLQLNLDMTNFRGEEYQTDNNYELMQEINIKESEI